MNILFEQIAEVLPSSSPWETLGGHDELATIIFLRGTILGSYGFIETQLNELAVRSSRIEQYHALCQKFPWKLDDRMKYLLRAFDIDGPLNIEAANGKKLIEDFQLRQPHRNKWAHGMLKVLPGSSNNRWQGAWITLTNYNPDDGQFVVSVDRWTGSEILEQAKKVKNLASVSNKIHCSVTQSLPDD